MRRIALFAAIGIAIGMLVFGGGVKGSFQANHPVGQGPRASMDPFTLMDRAPRDLPVEQHSGH